MTKEPSFFMLMPNKFECIRWSIYYLYYYFLYLYYYKYYYLLYLLLKKYCANRKWSMMLYGLLHGLDGWKASWTCDATADNTPCGY